MGEAQEAQTRIMAAEKQAAEHNPIAESATEDADGVGTCARAVIAFG